MTRRDIEIIVASNPGLLGAIRALVRGYFGAFGFDKDRIDEIVLAVDEACANSIRHAYGGPCNETFTLALLAEPEWVSVELRDDGCPAPAEKIRPKTLEAPGSASEATPGGLGLPLIYRVFDDVTFTPGATSGNHLCMRIKRPSGEREVQADGTHD